MTIITRQTTIRRCRLLGSDDSGTIILFYRSPPTTTTNEKKNQYDKRESCVKVTFGLRLFFVPVFFPIRCRVVGLAGNIDADVIIIVVVVCGGGRKRVGKVF